MFKTFGKLFSVFLLLLVSFMYTDKVFSEVRKSNPVMKEIVKYKEKKDIKPKNGIINNDELVLGYSGISINVKDSYNNMKQDKKFNEDKVVKDIVNPKISIKNTFDYYVTNGNRKNKKVAIIFKVKDGNNLDDILSLIAKKDVNVNFFIDGKFIEENTNTILSIDNLNSSVYNLGYNGIYKKNMIKVTNNLIESITMKDSIYCLNENKNNNYLKICSKNKMLSIAPSLIDPSISDIKKNLKNGMIISYDLNRFNINDFGVILNIIKTKGYTISLLNEVISEK